MWQRTMVLVAALSVVFLSCSDDSSKKSRKKPPGTTPCELSSAPGVIWSSIGDAQDVAHYGRRVEPAGDVNGDGYADLLVTGESVQTPFYYAGKAYLYLGGPQGLSRTPAWTSVGDAVGLAHYGFDIAGGGDVNGDGYDDVVVGAYMQDGIETEVGKAFVYAGGPGGLSPNPVWTSMGDESRGAHFGEAVAIAGDVNGDGFDDIVIGAEFFTSGLTGHQGKAYLYLGGPGGPQTSPTWTSLGRDESSAEYGRALNYAGDVNGDGFDDVVVGAPGTRIGGHLGCGEAFLYLGKADGLSTTPAWTTTGAEEYDSLYGMSVSTAGDVNGDGLDDFMIGEPRFDSASLRSGKAYLYHGSAGTISATPAWTSVGDSGPGAFFGYPVASAGDVNGDGLGDVVIGEEWYGPYPERPGRIYVYLGSSTGLTGTPAWSSVGDNQYECWFGHTATGVGDINGDGRTDIGAGAIYYDCDGERTGKAYVFSVGF